MNEPSRDELVEAIKAASAAHHEYETNALRGERDEQWAGWYAGYLLGRLGDFAAPSALAESLSTAPSSDDWAAAAAAHIEVAQRAR